MVNVTSVDFNSLNFAFTQNSCAYVGPQYEVQKVVTAAAVPGAVLSIDAPGDQRNASYVQRFAAPALQCSEVSEPLLGEIISNVSATSLHTNTSYGFLAWVPDTDSQLPFELKDQSDSQDWMMYQGDGQEIFQLRIGSLGSWDDTSLALFVATFPNFGELPNWVSNNASQDAESMITNWNYTTNATVVECKLMNATYSLSFN
jgi:hypothetical protein